MSCRTLLIALTFGEVLASGPCPAHQERCQALVSQTVSQTVSSSGQIDGLEDVATIDLMSMLQVSVTRHFHGKSSDLSKDTRTVADVNTTDAIHQTQLTIAKMEEAGRVIGEPHVEVKKPIDHVGKPYAEIEFQKPDDPVGEPHVEVEKPGVALSKDQTQYRQVPPEPKTNCPDPKACHPQSVSNSKSMTADPHRPDKQHKGIEKSEMQSGPITIRSKDEQRFEQQELALFLEEMAEEFVHDIVAKIKRAFFTGWSSLSCLLNPSKHHLKGVWNLEGDAFRSMVAYSEVMLVGIIAIASLSKQRKQWRLPHLQTAEVHLVLSLACLAVFARMVTHPAPCLALTLGLRYFVEGYMIVVAQQILPSTLGRCMTEALEREEKRAAEHFVLQGGDFERDSLHTTPPLLDVAIVQHRRQPEISPFPHSLPPMPLLLTVVLCFVRPLLSTLCALAPQHHQPLAMNICFWSNTWLIVLGLVLTTGFVRGMFSQIVQYVPACQTVALSVGLLPLLGGVQDLVLCGSLNSGAVSFAGMLYLHEVTAMTIFIMYMISQGVHFPREKLQGFDETEEIAGWQCWLQEVLNPQCVLKSFKTNKRFDVDSMP